MANRRASQSERLAEFYARLLSAPAARSFDEAFGQIHRILNQVEDDLSGSRFEPFDMPRGGRLHSPMWDSMARLTAEPGLWRLQSARHETFVGDNGSIVIYHRNPRTLKFEKAGEDGKGAILP